MGLEPLAHHGVRTGERLFRASDAGGDGDRGVVRQVLVQPDGAFGQGVFGIDQHRQRGVPHLDEFQRVLGQVAVLGEDDGDGLADVEDLLPGEQGHGGHPDQRVQEFGEARRGAQFFLVEQRGQVRHVVAGPHGDDAGCGQGRGHIDRFDTGVGVRAAQEGGLDGAGKGDVVDVAAVAAQQPVVLDAWDGPSDPVAVAGPVPVGIVGHAGHSPNRSSSA